jgi:cytochrome b561
MFALDSFAPELTFWQQIGTFLMHLVPSFILLALLVVAWKWEFVGGVIFTFVGVVTTPFIFLHNYRMNHSVWMSLFIILIITIPFLLVGILFLVNHRIKKGGY